MMITNLLSEALIHLNLLLILMTNPTQAFMVAFSKSRTHQNITREAVLQTTADICQTRALSPGQNSVSPNTLTSRSVAGSCYSSDSTKKFEKSLDEISNHNVLVDILHPFEGDFHFDNELFDAGRNRITIGVSVVKYSIKQKSYEAAREALGKVLHTLQDFYSHSNWVELGKTQPYSNLIKPDTLISNIADSATCRKCTTDVCRGNILEEVIAQQKLTSGYFGVSKPKGKCSHGGKFDLTSLGEGGINKDDAAASHGYLHDTAALLATAASKDLLQDIRAAVGDSEFLRMLGLSQNSVLCFVIDTTSSMSEDIAEVRRVTSSIVDSTTAQSSEYILVPFNDPGFGPFTRISDPNAFKQQLNALTASGGGDVPEMSLSALQLALTGSPPQTNIFVFTDADAKDKGLKNTLQALIERTKSTVTFMLINTTAGGQLQVPAQIFNPQIYQELAQASGGQAIEVTKETLSQATNIITVTSKSTMVTLFQAVRNPGNTESFSFTVDSTVQTLVMYITGNSLDYTISSPAGVSQSSSVLNGTLGIIQKVGNFHSVQPNSAGLTGLWVLKMNTKQPYSIRVVGQSMVDFLFVFVNSSQGVHTSYVELKTRPSANKVTLLLTMVGLDSGGPAEVSLVEASSSNAFTGTLEELTSGQYLVNFTSIPTGKFTVRVVGQLSSTKASGSTFQRQTSTQFQTSTLTITTQPVGTVEPGKQLTLPFTVTTTSPGKILNIGIGNDRNFTAVYNTQLTLDSGGSATGIVTLTVPEKTPSGSDVTMTIEAEFPDGSDFNYVVLRIAILAAVTDVFPPICDAIRIYGNCSGNCSFSSWYLTTNISDGSGVQKVGLLKGNGSLNTTSVLNATGVNITMAVYSASCCYQSLELVAVDTVGNVATCFKSAAPPSTLSYGGAFCLFVPICLWLNIGVSFY